MGYRWIAWGTCVLASACVPEFATENGNGSGGSSSTTEVTNSVGSGTHSTSTSDTTTETHTTTTWTATTTSSSTSSSSSSTSSSSTSTSTTTPNTCAHNECTQGDELYSSCSSCVTLVCEGDPYCCETSWDYLCVGAAEDLCAMDCGLSNACAHDICQAGAALDIFCSDCATTICGQFDPACCTTEWTSNCASFAAMVCSAECE